MSNVMNIEKVRADTPMTLKSIYFNTAAASVPPDPVVEEVRSYLLDVARLGPDDPDFRKDNYARVEAARSDLAAFLGAGADEMAFTKNGTESISLIAQGIDWRPGDEVLVADTEMLSNVLPWQALAARRGVIMKTVEADADGLLRPGAVEAAFTAKTRLLTFAHVPNSTGAVQAAREICALAHRHHVMTLVNGSQSVGMVETDVEAMRCDFLAGCGRKALRATDGSGFLYVRRVHIERIEPALLGWGNGRRDAATDELSYVPGARRLEAGCPVFPSILGLGAAVRYAQQIGIPAIEARVRELTAYAVRRLERIPGFELYGPREVGRRIGILPFNIRGFDPAHISSYLHRRRCVIEAGSFMAASTIKRYGISRMARISLHYFNTHEEIDHVAALIELMDPSAPVA